MTSVSYDTITQAEYRTFQQAYDFFNRELFDGSLPDVLVTLQRRGNSRGYFSRERFVGRNGQKEAAHELALNPDHFGRTDAEICSTLVHEMCHTWQTAFGVSGRNGYHNKQWAQKMKEVGLFPSDTGEPGGKQTGQRVTHYIIEGGAFALVFANLEATGFQLRWQSRADNKDRQKKADSKTKYTCPICEQNAWAKPDASLICGQCFEEDGEISEMVADPLAAVAA